jgi:hypothetical protein
MRENDDHADTVVLLILAGVVLAALAVAKVIGAGVFA